MSLEHQTDRIIEAVLQIREGHQKEWPQFGRPIARLSQKVFFLFQCCTGEQTGHLWHMHFAVTIIQRTIR